MDTRLPKLDTQGLMAAVPEARLPRDATLPELEPEQPAAALPLPVSAAPALQRDDGQVVLAEAPSALPTLAWRLPATFSTLTRTVTAQMLSDRTICLAVQRRQQTLQYALRTVALVREQLMHLIRLPEPQDKRDELKRLEAHRRLAAERSL